MFGNKDEKKSNYGFWVIYTENCGFTRAQFLNSLKLVKTIPFRFRIFMAQHPVVQDQ